MWLRGATQLCCTKQPVVLQILVLSARLTTDHTAMENRFAGVGARARYQFCLDTMRLLEQVQCRLQSTIGGILI